MQSREVTKVFSSLKDVYYEAFRAAEKEFKSNSGWRDRMSSEGIDVQI